MTKPRDIPCATYGILERRRCDTQIDEIIEQIVAIGYAVVDVGYADADICAISEEFDVTRARYIETYGEAHLRKADEYYSVRSPLTHGGAEFLGLALNEKVLSIVGRLIQGKFILNQQNGIVNPPQETYNQGAWHRDLPYQHFVSSTPLAINALFCVDDFTPQNGATFVLPASHKLEAFPSESYVQKNAVQIEAKAGSYIVLDCMVFHAGGINKTTSERRAVNHLYNIPFFKQQISLPTNMNADLDLTNDTKEILGFTVIEPCSIEEYIRQRAAKISKG